MTLVVDASVAMQWLFELDRSDRAEAMLNAGEQIIAPDLVIPEITNAIWKSVAFGDRTPGVAITILGETARHFDELVPSVVLKDRALAIALKLRHAAYECFYLALAEMRECRFVTADERLLRRCADTPFAGRVRPL
jgi:predicted nucleic acid-binding protein